MLYIKVVLCEFDYIVAESTMIKEHTHKILNPYVVLTRDHFPTLKENKFHTPTLATKAFICKTVQSQISLLHCQITFNTRNLTYLHSHFTVRLFC